MCDRFTASFEFRQRDLPIFAPRYNIAPSQQVPVIVRGAPGTGFVQAPPFWTGNDIQQRDLYFYYV